MFADWCNNTTALHAGLRQESVRFEPWARGLPLTLVDPHVGAAHQKGGGVVGNVEPPALGNPHPTAERTSPGGVAK